MSRSRKKTPISGIAKEESDKPYKKKHSRQERRAVTDALKKIINQGAAPEADEIVGLEHPQVKYDDWNTPKDGKKYWNDPINYRK